MGGLSGPTEHGFRHYKQERTAATVLKGFAPFAPPKPNAAARPTTPRRIIAGGLVERIPPFLESLWETFRALMTSTPELLLMCETGEVAQHT